MNETTEFKVDLHFEVLPGYADYLLREQLDQFVRYLYESLKSLDVPLLKFFSGMEEKEILKLSKDGNIQLLSAIRDNKIKEYIDQSRIGWVMNQLPVITKTDVIAEDIGLIGFARRRTFREFLPGYTTNAAESFKIIDELDQFILTHESVLVKTYLAIQQEKLAQSHKELKKREEELLEAQELAKIGSFEWDLTQGKKSTYTPQVFKIFEFEQTSNLEAFLNDVHPDDRLKVRASIEKALSDGTYECEYRYSRNNKDKVLYSQGRVIFDKGKPSRMIGTVADITERANLVARLLEHEELGKQAQALTNTGNWKWSIDADTIEWSDEMYRIYGLEPQSEQITFQRFLKFIHPDDRNRRLTEIAEAVKTGIASDYIMRINSQDGKEKVLKGKGRVLKDKFGKSIGMLGTCQDITNEYHLTSELKKKNEELVRKNKDLESFNFIASHDLQEPLRKIQTYSNRIQQEGASTIPESLLSHFAKISQASKRMQKMIEDFLDFYHSLNMIDQPEFVQLESIVQTACEQLNRGGTTKTFKLSIGPLPQVFGRKVKLTQMFRHLLSNAVKFAKTSIPLEIAISCASRSKGRHTMSLL